ncbi:hypothetical protein GT037_006082 [Alternaria burnsii]|uniref:Uncharacterized protein n=1 Tax=Alternaria burnsii TaxID=1187904 RepID=A0A8H7B8L5_9PLEO|nr:uncharacterized protein GT037_006082 [Alternaria burnsii]KAF7676577.1 hypothetical protein GT037_006082 [Alternaria burnsii]
MSSEELLGLQEKGTHESLGRKLANTMGREERALSVCESIDVCRSNVSCTHLGSWQFWLADITHARVESMRC